MSGASGVYIYIWDGQQCDGGDTAAIHRHAKAHGVGELWKAADGGNWYPQPKAISAIIDEARQAGVPVATWDYWYGAEAGTQYYGYTVAGWQQEIARAQETIACGPDFHAGNNEAEYEGRWQVAAQVGAALNASTPATVRLYSACLPVIRYHLSSPYRQWSDFGFHQAPEFYWSMFRGTYVSPRYGWEYQRASQTPRAGIVWEAAGGESLVRELRRMEAGSASDARLLDGPMLVAFWQQDCTQYQISQSGLAPSYMDAPLDAPLSGVSDAEITAFLATLDPTTVKSIWVWDWQHMDAAAFVRAQRVGEWLALEDPKHKAQSLLQQAVGSYQSGNALLAQVIPLLEGRATTPSGILNGR